MRAAVVITGAAGALGRALAPLCSSQGLVIGLDRSAREDTPPGVAELRQQDVEHADWNALLGEDTTVFHLAAYVHRTPRTPEEEVESERVNHRATVGIAEACREAGSKLVFASTVSVYGGGTCSAFQGDRPLAPSTTYGRHKAAAEGAIRAESGRGLRYAILRFPLLYGPRGRGNMERMLRAIRNRRYWPIGDPSVEKSCLYYEDAARALWLAASSPFAESRALDVAPPKAATMGEIHAAAYEAMGRLRPPALPASVARAAARAGDRIAAILGRPTGLLSSVETLLAPASFDGSRFAAATGFAPQVSLAEGLARTGRWILEAGR